MSEPTFPWNLITEEMLAAWSAKACHMSEFHMMGEAYLMIEKAKKAETATRPEPRRPFLELD